MKMDVNDIKRRVAYHERLSPEQCEFVIDCINEATKPVGFSGPKRYEPPPQEAGWEFPGARGEAPREASWKFPGGPRVIKHDAPNYMGRIETLWAYLSIDEGGEGVCAAPLGPLPVVPLIAADRARVESIKPIARELAKRFGKPVRLAKFSTREDVEIYQP
jgi:hypothetical protein